MADLQLFLSKDGDRHGRRIVSIDTEWAKNWTAQEKFIPFCATVHVVYLPNSPTVLDIESWAMDTHLHFRSKHEGLEEYARSIDDMLRRSIAAQTVVVGHQLCSDLHLLCQVARRRLPSVERVLAGFSSRRSSPPEADFAVRDTRYDIASRVIGNGAEKLRNVSLRLRVFAVQNELNKCSLTRLYNQYVSDGDRLKMEKLMVMNWRHAFQTALVWLVDSHPELRLVSRALGEGCLVTNDVIFGMGRGQIDYLDTPEYQVSRTKAGIADYVMAHAPRVAEEAGLTAR